MFLNPWSTTFYLGVYSVCSHYENQPVNVFSGEIIIIYCENRTNHKNTEFKIKRFLMLKQMYFIKV
jgi:hypothetical protein